MYTGSASMRGPRALTVFMFSGQGSQYFQMGRELFEQEPVFRDSMLWLDRMVHELCGRSVIEELYSPHHQPSASFDRILLTNPAIFMVEYALAQALMSVGVRPDITLGASLGSFVAATVAGFVSVEHAMAAVIKLADIVEERCEPGGMIAIVSSLELYRQEFLSANSELAAVNFATHFVIAAPQGRIPAIEKELQARNVPYHRLPVSFAFHSKWIDAAGSPFEEALRRVSRNNGLLPMVCCERAELLATLPGNYFWHVARNPIRFRDAIAAMERRGAYRYIDVGPAGTMATFLKYELSRKSDSKALSILTPYGRDMANFTAVVS